MPHTSRRRWISGLLIYGLFALCVFGFILNGLRINGNYNRLFGNTVSCSPGVLDLTDYEGNDRETVRFLGEAEFYFNTWLITDGETDRTPDGFLRFSDRWTSLEKDGRPLPKTGYASYRFVICNATRDFYFKCYEDMYSMPWRAFADGQLVAYSGTMGRTVEESAVCNDEEFGENVLCRAGEEHEIVIEVGATDSAGRIVPNRLVLTDDTAFISGYNAFFKATDNIANMAMGLLLASLIFLLIFALISKNYWVSVSYGLIMLAILLTLLFSLDYFRTLRSLFPSVQWTAVEIAQYLTAIFTLAVLAWHLTVSRLIRFRGTELAVYVTMNLLLLALTVLSNGYNRQMTFVLMNLLCYDYLVFKLFSGVRERRTERIAYALMLFMLNLFYIFEAWDYTGRLVYKGARIYSYVLMVIMLGIITVYLAQIRSVQQKVLRAETMEKEKILFQSQVLRSQIKPHFIFNTLTLIIERYRHSREEGEKTLRLMADYMRTNVNAGTAALVSFEEELRAADMYFELCNIRKDDKMQLFHDIDAYDFEVPLLSLQPLIENAVKYAKIEEKEDGHITVKSYETRSTFVVEVTDNGIGFDIAAIRDGAVGIRNVRERFRLLLDAETVVLSTPGCGTTVRIEIPKGGKRT